MSASIAGEEGSYGHCMSKLSADSPLCGFVVGFDDSIHHPDLVLICECSNMQVHPARLTRLYTLASLQKLQSSTTAPDQPCVILSR